MKKKYNSLIKLTNIDDPVYLDCVKDLICNPDVASMSDFIQHSDTTCLDHCIDVSYKSYKIASLLNLDFRSVARAGLLHDFFLYDWHVKSNRRGLHGFTHAKTAHHNARSRFELNKIERDIILKHMWPLTPKPPRYIESFIVLLVDKYCAIIEILPSKSKNDIPEFEI